MPLCVLFFAVLFRAAPAAWAHSPHDVAKWVAVSPGPEPAWIVTSLVRFDAWMVTRTRDGDVIETRYLLPDTEDVAAAALLGPERLFLGTGGLGLWASEDAGDSFRVHPDLPADATVHKIALSNGLAGTFDGGRSWSSLALEALGGAEDVYLPLDFAAVPHVLAVGLAQGGAGWALSTDGGHTWRAGRAPLEEEATCNVAAFSDGYAEDGLAWIACGSHGEVFVTDDEGATWSTVGAAGARIEGMAGSPGGEALFLATLDGLRVSQAGGAPERLAFRGEPVWDVVISPGWPADPTVFALAAASGWFRSDDGGQSWIELARPSGDVFQNLAISPNFAEDGAVAAAGFSGAWVSLDRGETWQDIHAVEIVDTRHPYWRLSDGWAMVPDERSLNLEFAQAITPGEGATGSFYGVGLALLGPPGLDAKGSLSIRLDGQGEGTVDLRDFRGAGRPELFSAWDLDEGWHTPEITAEDGTVVFDAVEVQRLPFTLTSIEEEAGGCRGRCQVASGAGSGAWLPPLVLVVWRSRRRARGRSAPG